MDLSQDEIKRSAAQHKASVTEPSAELVRSRTAVAAPRDLSRLMVETVSPPPASRLMDLKKGGTLGAERMRLLRMRLWEMRRQGQLNTVAITSSLPKDGKSTVALNLATTLGDGNQHSVLLIEADLHCPSVAKNLGMRNNAGLCECLETGADPFSYIRRIEPMGWYLLQAGATQLHPTDLIQSQAFPDVLAVLAPHFDWIVIDTPPVLPVADTLSICQSSDAVLLVVRSGVTPRESVNEAVGMIGSDNIAAIILNGSEEINKSYYKYSSYYASKKSE